VIGIVLLFVALGVSCALVLVLVTVVRGILREREVAGRVESSGEEDVGAARRAPPPLKRWLACSGVAVVIVTAVAAIWFQGCQALGRARKRAQDLAYCSQSVAAQADWFGQYWDQKKQLPTEAEVPLIGINCPLGNQFRYVGERQIMLGGNRLLLIELDCHDGGQRHALVVSPSFLKDKKTVAEQSGETLQPGNAWMLSYYYRNYFRQVTVSEGQYETIRAQVEGTGGGGEGTAP
jgi:hypothetical protein